MLLSMLHSLSIRDSVMPEGYHGYNLDSRGMLCKGATTLNSAIITVWTPNVHPTYNTKHTYCAVTRAIPWDLHGQISHKKTHSHAQGASGHILQKRQSSEWILHSVTQFEHHRQVALNGVSSCGCRDKRVRADQ